MATIEVLNQVEAVVDETPVITVSMSNAIYQGPKGEDGYTPVKGVDYFTEEDKAELMKASNISYDNSNNQIEGVETVQKAIDLLLDTAIDEPYLDSILASAGYQTEEQVIALIQQYGGSSGESLPSAEEVEF